MVCPVMCPTIGVTARCIWASLRLSAGTFTICVKIADVLAALLALPSYLAEIEWLPRVSETVAKVAVPDASVPVPICLPPSRKLTEPVGEAPVTRAVNVTDCRRLEGFCDDESAIVV